MKRVAVLGGGVEGRAAAAYWLSLGDEVTIRDQNPDVVVPAGVKLEAGPAYLEGLDAFDLIVRSPGIKPRDIVTNTPITSGTREFFAKCPARIVGVTGTKGKGTTSSLITRILEAAGKKVWLGGNIGRPPLEFLAKVKASDVVVLELSSFQLMDLDQSPAVAVCLLVEPEHLDWHKDVREYVSAKGNIFWHQHTGDRAIYNPKSEYSAEIAQLSKGERVPYGERPGAFVRQGEIVIEDTVICRTDEVGLPGPHNLENICAAVTAAWSLVEKRVKPVRQAVMEFTGLPLRIERLGEIDHVLFVNDSYSTNPAASIAAMRSFNAPKIVILGGYDRGNDFAPLARAVAEAGVRRVLLIGQTGPRIGEALATAGFKDFDEVRGGVREIIAAARRAAQPGDVVIFSPGCASFDMFANFTARGEAFTAEVRRHLGGK